ncbi:MAG: hypothetical protein U5K37_03790 [Natrialbaceae archaeon]|nr:hypothetical protein [Natrialbaceae archaeon]
MNRKTIERAGPWMHSATLSEDGSLVVGAPYSNATDLHAGSVHVVAGEHLANGPVELSDADTTIRGEAAGEHAGWSVAATPCVVTCGEAPDLTIGAPGSDAADRQRGHRGGSDDR